MLDQQANGKPEQFDKASLSHKISEKKSKKDLKISKESDLPQREASSENKFRIHAKDTIRVASQKSSDLDFRELTPANFREEVSSSGVSYSRTSMRSKSRNFNSIPYRPSKSNTNFSKKTNEIVPKNSPKNPVTQKSLVPYSEPMDSPVPDFGSEDLLAPKKKQLT